MNKAAISAKQEKREEMKMDEMWDWVRGVFTREITIFGKHIKNAKTGPQPFMCCGEVPNDVRDVYIAYLKAGKRHMAEDYMRKIRKELEAQKVGKVYLNYDGMRNEIDILMLSPLYGGRDEEADVSERRINEQSSDIRD